MQNEIHAKLKYAGYQYNGSEWDDGAHQKIVKIILGARMSVISSIRVVYEEPDENIKLASEHGGVSRFFKVITVKEPITRIVGTYGYSTSAERYGITYLEFSGSTTSYGSLGKKVGLSFIFESDSGFTGFHGRADEGITALGVYVNCTDNLSSKRSF